MSGVNKVILVGRLGADPELRYTNNGTAVCEFSLATSESWKDKGGQKQERTEWHKVVFWAQAAETLKKYCTKGQQLYVEGKLQTEKWQDKDGNDRYTTKVIGSQFTFLGSKGEQGSATQPQQPEPSYQGGADDDAIPF